MRSAGAGAIFTVIPGYVMGVTGMRGTRGVIPALSDWSVLLRFDDGSAVELVSTAGPDEMLGRRFLFEPVLEVSARRPWAARMSPLP